MNFILSHFFNCRSSRAESLSPRSEAAFNTENGFNTSYVSATGNSRNYPHRYSTINDNLTMSTRRTKETSFSVPSMPQLKPPAILKSKSLTPMPMVVPLTAASHHNEPHYMNNSFEYTRLTDAQPTHNDPITTINWTVSGQNGNMKSQDKKSNETSHYSERKYTDNDVESVTSKAQKLNTTEGSEQQLENWDYEWNPMYMKVPVGLRMINTL